MTENNIDQARSLNQHGALLSQKALKEIFGEVSSFSIEATKDFFCLEFSLKQELFDEHLRLIEEKVSSYKLLEPLFYPMEMLTKNARELFNHHKQFDQLQLLSQESAQIVSIVKEGSTYSLVPYEAYEVDQLYFFKALGFEKQYSKDRQITYQLTGSCQLEFNNLKKNSKLYKAKQKSSFILSCKKFNWIDLERKWILPKGVAVLIGLEASIVNLAHKFNFKRVISLSDSPEEIEGFEDYFWLTEKENDATSFFEKSKKVFKNLKRFFYSKSVNSKQLLSTCNYCLNFNLELVKILGFSYRMTYCKSNSLLISQNIEKSLEQTKVECRIKSAQKDTIEFDVMNDLDQKIFKMKIEIFQDKNQIKIKGDLGTSIEELWIHLTEQKKVNATLLTF